MWQVVGQTRALALLQRSLEKGSLAHAYLFVGPAHVGKMTLALNLAQALNCQGTEPPCGECAACQRVAAGKHADVQTIGLNQDGSSAEARTRAEISIDQIREVQHAASLPPFEGRHKVFIIDGAELLSTEAANCLLKTLEEPVDRMLFILVTANEQLLPATVVSRCQRVELFPTAVAEIETALTNSWDVAPEKAVLLARLSRGSLGWAVSAALDEGLLRQRAERLDGLLDVIDTDNEERFVYAARLAAQFGRNRGAVHDILDSWLGWWRDLLLVKVGRDGDITNIDHLTTLTDMTGNYGLVQIRAFIDCIRATGDQLRQNANPRLALEVLMLSIPEAERHGERNSAVQVEVSHG